MNIPQVGSLLMLKSGNKAIVLYHDEITSSAKYYDFNEAAVKSANYQFLADSRTVVGDWEREWDSEEAYYKGVISVILAECQSNILGDMTPSTSVSAIEREVVPEIHGEDVLMEHKTLWFAHHQQFGKRVEFLRNANILKIIKDTCADFVSIISASQADRIIMRTPIEVLPQVDEWTGKRYLSFYTRFSLLKNNEQVNIKWGDIDERTSNY